MPNPKTPDEILAALRSNEAYAHIDIDRELKKADAWCLVNNRRLTARFFVAWLNRIDPPLRPQNPGAARSSQISDPRSQIDQPDCTVCHNERFVESVIDADAKYEWARKAMIPCPACKGEPPASAGGPTNKGEPSAK